ncbi:MAG: queuosine precursor transporter, partial [Proteobacteria bacterium]|nr:queuosine precursor transporter [Pseudomonadota bacterium]
MFIKFFLNNKRYSLHGYKRNKNGDTVIQYGLANKRVFKPLEAEAKKIITTKVLYNAFSQEDIINITTLAQKDAIMRSDNIDTTLLTDKNQPTKYQWYPFLVAFMAVMWCFCAIIGHRFTYLDTQYFSIILPGAIIIFPVIYFCADAIQEIYGYKRARQALWVCIFCHFMLTLSVSLILWFNPAPNVDAHAYYVVLHTEWRMFLGNAIGMIAGVTINGIVLSKMKIFFEGKHLWLRSIASTLIAEAVYSVVCSSIAFNDALSVMQLIKLQAGMVAIKVLWEIFFTPLLYLITSKIKASEGIDIYDRYTNFNPFSLDVEYQTSK